MKRRVRSTAVVVLLCSLALPAWGRPYYIYEPKPAAPEAKGQTKEGILVEEIPIQKGDTLYDISRKFSGHGMYYPQILLFNDIKNPDLIHYGDSLKVPIPKGGTPERVASTRRPRAEVQKRTVKSAKKGSAKAASPTSKKHLPAAVARKTAESPIELSLSELKKIDSGKHKRRVQAKNAGGTVARRGAVTKQDTAAIPLPKVKETAAPVSAMAGQQLFEKAVKAYRQDECRTALELFDRYLAENPGSPMAADASLYKADCYLKLSTQ